jgi:hypothetical protein
MRRNRKHFITPPDKPVTREISGVYHDIFGPVAQHEHKLRRERGRRKSRTKAEKEMETTLRGLNRTRTPEALARDKVLHNAQQKRWAKDNPDKVSKYQKNWKAKQDPELLRAYDRDRYLRDAEKIKARRRESYARKKA